MHRKLILSVMTVIVMVVAGCSSQTAEMSVEPPAPQGPTSPVTEINPTPAPIFAQPATAPGNAQFVSTMNLYGEMPGAPNTMPTESLNNLQQVSFSTEGADFDVAIDPTGKWLIYASTRHRPTSDLYIKRVDGSSVTQLTSDPGNDTMPAISPDGKLVAFSSDRTGTWNLYITSIEGGKAMQLTDGPSQDLHPNWSPDGTKIVFSSLSTQSGQWEMVVVDVANPVNRQYIGQGLFPQFNPMGNKIAFQRARFRGTRWFSVWTVDWQDGQAKRPTEVISSANAAVITPTWSPDGQRLAFVTVVNPGNDPTLRPAASDLWIINADGTGRINLTSDHHVNLQPTWGPNGRLYFVSNRGQSDNIWVVNTGDTMLVQPTLQKEPEQTQVMVPTE